MRKGLLVGGGAKQNGIALGNHFQSCTEEETQDVYKGLLE